MFITGFLSAAGIGFILGLTGGGGAILTVPVLVYFFGIEPMTATSYSLFIVGITSLAGAFYRYRLGQVDFSVAMAFGIPSLLSLLFTRNIILPTIPPILFTIQGHTVTRAAAIMIFFSLLMIVAGWAMMSHKNNKPLSGQSKQHYPRLMMVGITEGLITGIAGAGGGFIIIPALIILLQLPVQTAVGTSLVIIAFKSLPGFAGDLLHHTINWRLLLPVTALAVAGIIFGNRLSNKIQAPALKKSMGWFVLIMGIFIFVKEVLHY